MCCQYLDTDSMTSISPTDGRGIGLERGCEGGGGGFCAAQLEVEDLD